MATPVPPETRPSRSEVAPSDWQHRDRFATAFDELAVLREMGESGWELTAFGPLLLHFRRPEEAAARQRWEYRRLNDLGTPPPRHELARDGWVSCGRWGIFEYLKRPAA